MSRSADPLDDLSLHPSEDLHEAGADMPIFEGAAELIECLRLLVRRPRRREAPRMTGLSARRPLPGIPMVCLIRRGDNGMLLQALARLLTRARPRSIPHVVHRYPDTERFVLDSPALAQDTLEVSGAPARHEDAAAIITVLLALSRGLGSGTNARGGRIRFARFGLVRWLMTQNLDVEDADTDAVLRSRLRGRDVARARYSGVFSKELPELADGVLPKWAQLLHLFPPLWFLVRLSGRVPGVGTEYRWLLRQPYLAPLDPGTFLGFAERLSVGQRRREDPEQILRLLVHAFLADLRSAYRRRPWRPRAARRTAYPVVLLDGITRANNGYRLLRLINDVRNDTGLFDPLLIITASQTVPPDAGAADQAHARERIWSATTARSGYQAWCRQIANDSRARTKTAWYLPVQIPAVLSREDVDSSSRYIGAVQELQAVAPLAIDPAPLWSRQSTTSALAITALTAVLASGYLVHHARDLAQQRALASVSAEQRAHCGLSSSMPGAATLRLVHNPQQNDECVGITDGSYAFQPGTDMAVAQRQIAAGNRQAEQLHRGSPKRPYATLVYIGILTQRDASTDFADQIWSLEGIAAAQSLHNQGPGPEDKPILRILIANAGDSMNYGSAVAGMIGELKEQDPSIVGVLGLDESRDPTIRTIKELTRQELPMIASALSADVLSSISQWYFQMSPNNSREADVASGWVQTMLTGAAKKNGVILLASNDPKDKYSSDLTSGFTRHLNVRHKTIIKYAPGSYTDAGDAIPGLSRAQAGEMICRRDDVVVFTGRHSDFQELLTSLTRHCPHDPPVILGGDDVSRYVANTSRLADNTIPFYYVSFAVGPKSCESAHQPYHEIGVLFPKGTCIAQGDPSLDGHAALAYDATNAYLQVIDRITAAFPGDPLTSAQIMAYLPGLRFTGQTGEIDLSNPDPAGHGVPLDKSIAILKVQPGKPPRLVGQCHAGPSASTPWCPEANRANGPDSRPR